MVMKARIGKSSCETITIDTSRRRFQFRKISSLQYEGSKRRKRERSWVPKSNLYMSLYLYYDVRVYNDGKACKRQAVRIR